MARIEIELNFTSYFLLTYNEVKTNFYCHGYTKIDLRYNISLKQKMVQSNENIIKI